MSVVVTSRSFSKNPKLREELLKYYPNTKFNDNGLILNGIELVKFMSGYKKAIIGLEKIDYNVLSKLPDLEVISKYGVGLDMIDMVAMKNFGIKLGWTAGINKRAVSELVIWHILSLMRNTLSSRNEVLKGNWSQIKGRQLTNSTVGIVGCGHIGKDLVNLLSPFSCKILVHDIIKYSDFYKEHKIECLDLDELLKKSDVVTLHLPLNSSTKKIINIEKLKLLKKNAILINLARGGLVDEEALYTQLISGCLAGAGLDVLEFEPAINKKLMLLDNVIITPHIGGSTDESIMAMGMAAINGLENFRCPSFYKNYFELSE